MDFDELVFLSEPSITTKYQASIEFAGSHNYYYTPTTKGGFWRPIPIIGHEGPLQVEALGSVLCCLFCKDLQMRG